jgi:carbonic anhydrase
VQVGTSSVAVDIDLQNIAPDGELTKLECGYTALPPVVLNNGHSLQVQGAPGQSLEANGKRYKLERRK